MTAKKYLTTKSGSAWIATDAPRFAKIRDGLEKPASDRAYYIAMGVTYSGRYEFPVKSFYWANQSTGMKFKSFPALND